MAMSENEKQRRHRDRVAQLRNLGGIWARKSLSLEHQLESHRDASDRPLSAEDAETLRAGYHDNEDANYSIEDDYTNVDTTDNEDI